jgi:uncharacterized membrane protein
VVAYGLLGRGLGAESLEPAELARLVPGLLGMVAVAALLLIPLVVAVLPVTLFAVPELLIGRCGPVEALRRAWQLGRGQRLRVLGYTLVTSVVVLLGVLACLVGVIPALPLAYLLLLGLFLALRNGSGLPAAVHD